MTETPGTAADLARTIAFLCNLLDQDLLHTRKASPRRKCLAHVCGGDHCGSLLDEEGYCSQEPELHGFRSAPDVRPADLPTNSVYPAARTKYDDQPIQQPENVPEPPATTYSIPHPPPTEYRVIDDNGRRWVHTRNHHGLFARVLWATDRPIAYDYLNDIPAELEWPALLAAYGPVKLDTEWTEAEKESFRLYGPPGARWGNPDQECPHYACTLGWGHTGLHVDAAGDPIEPPPADGTTIDASVTPHEASQTPCTCGHPDRHRPDCPRYARVSGVEQPADPDSQKFDTERGF